MPTGIIPGSSDKSQRVSSSKAQILAVLYIFSMFRVIWLNWKSNQSVESIKQKIMTVNDDCALNLSDWILQIIQYGKCYSRNPATRRRGFRWMLTVFQWWDMKKYLLKFLLGQSGRAQNSELSKFPTQVGILKFAPIGELGGYVRPHILMETSRLQVHFQLQYLQTWVSWIERMQGRRGWWVTLRFSVSSLMLVANSHSAR